MCANVKRQAPNPDEIDSGRNTRPRSSIIPHWLITLEGTGRNLQAYLLADILRSNSTSVPNELDLSFELLTGLFQSYPGASTFNPAVHEINLLDTGPEGHIQPFLIHDDRTLRATVLRWAARGARGDLRFQFNQSSNIRSEDANELGCQFDQSGAVKSETTDDLRCHFDQSGNVKSENTNELKYKFDQSSAVRSENVDDTGCQFDQSGNVRSENTDELKCKLDQSGNVKSETKKDSGSTFDRKSVVKSKTTNYGAGKRRM